MRQEQICFICANKFYFYKNKKCERKYCSRSCYRKGHVVWNKGKTYTKEEKKKINISGLEKGRGFWKGKKLPYKVPTSFKKGHIPWSKSQKGVTLNTGRTHFKKGTVPLNIILKLKKWQREHEVWNKGKHFPQVAGSNNHNWKGGITSIHMKIRDSIEYEDWRKKVFERDNFTCQFCNEIGGRLEADHIKPFSLFPELRTNLDNGQTLCKSCHSLKTSEDMKLIKKHQKYGKKNSILHNS